MALTRLYSPGNGAFFFFTTVPSTANVWTSMRNFYQWSNTTLMVYQNVGLHIIDAYWWKIDFPHNTSGASGMYVVVHIIWGGYANGTAEFTVAGYDYEGTPTWYPGGCQSHNKPSGIRAVFGNDGSHPCLLIGSDDRKYWNSLSVTYTYYHSGSHEGKVTISAASNSTSGITRRYELG